MGFNKWMNYIFDIVTAFLHRRQSFDIMLHWRERYGQFPSPIKYPNQVLFTHLFYGFSLNVILTAEEKNQIDNSII